MNLHMNLRIATILTITLVLIGTIVFSVILFHNGDHNVRQFQAGNCAKAVFIWILNGMPLLVSFFFAIILKHKTSTAILLVSTITYGIWYAYGWYLLLPNGSFTTTGVFSGFGPGSLGVLSLPVMVVVWTAALVVNVDWSLRNAKKH